MHVLTYFGWLSTPHPKGTQCNCTQPSVTHNRHQVSNSKCAINEAIKLQYAHREADFVRSPISTFK